MLIKSTLSPQSASAPKPRSTPETQTDHAPAPKDSFRSSRILETCTRFAVGVAPGLGTVANGREMLINGIFGSDSKSNIGKIGAIANLAGTAGLIAGAVTGNSTVLAASSAALIGSGVALAANS